MRIRSTKSSPCTITIRRHFEVSRRSETRPPQTAAATRPQARWPPGWWPLQRQKRKPVIYAGVIARCRGEAPGPIHRDRVRPTASWHPATMESRRLVRKKVSASSRTSRANGLVWMVPGVGLRPRTLTRIINFHVSGQPLVPFFRSNPPNRAARTTARGGCSVHRS